MNFAAVSLFNPFSYIVYERVQLNNGFQFSILWLHKKIFSQRGAFQCYYECLKEDTVMVAFPSSAASQTIILLAPAVEARTCRVQNANAPLISLGQVLPSICYSSYGKRVCGKWTLDRSVE
jgi:hypothetical protein